MRAVVCAALFAAAAISSANAGCEGHPSSCVKDYAINYPGRPTPPPGSTHEITFNRNGGKTLWLTAPTYDKVVEIAPGNKQKYFPLPAGTMPHGIVFDSAGQLFVSLERGHRIVRMNPANGKVEADVAVDADPHGLNVGPDGKTLWFTGKTMNVVGKIMPDGHTVKTFPLATAEAFPIYIAAGPDGNMWFTELTGNNIGRVTADGVITEFPIPTKGSRPIAIVPDPSGQPAMWFSEEAGNRVARIDMSGTITEFQVPKSQENVILAGLAFDGEGNLWVQQYVDQNNPSPAGPDHVIKIGKSILTAKPGDKLTVTTYEVPTQKAVMHRIIQGPDKNMWFTELKSDRVGRVDDKSR